MDTTGLILEAVPKKELKIKGFVITLTFMHGDASLYTKEKIVLETREALDDFFAVTDVYFGWGWNERIDKIEKPILSAMPEYWVFTSADDKETYLNDEHPEWWENYWPCDETSDCFHKCMLSSYSISYFDEYGVEFTVTRE